MRRKKTEQISQLLETFEVTDDIGWVDSSKLVMLFNDDSTFELRGEDCARFLSSKDSILQVMDLMEDRDDAVLELLGVSVKNTEIQATLEEVFSSVEDL